MDIVEMSRFRLARNKQILHFLETSLVFFLLRALFYMLGYNLASAEEGSWRWRTFFRILTISLFLVTFFSQITQSSRQVFSHRYDAKHDALRVGPGGGCTPLPPPPRGFHDCEKRLTP